MSEVTTFLGLRNKHFRVIMWVVKEREWLRSVPGYNYKRKEGL